MNDLDGDTLTYSVTFLPTTPAGSYLGPGLSIDPTTGVISGFVDVNGPTNYTVTVSVTDGNGGQLDRTFTLTILDEG